MKLTTSAIFSKPGSLFKNCKFRQVQHLQQQHLIPLDLLTGRTVMTVGPQDGTIL
jgi:hypothetical protein